MLDNRKAILFVRGERPMLDDKYDLMHHPNIRLTEDGGAAPYDYTHAKDAADDLDYSCLLYTSSKVNTSYGVPMVLCR